MCVHVHCTRSQNYDNMHMGLLKVGMVCVLRSLRAIPWAACTAGFVITYLAYAPGLMTPDGRDQFEQATTGHFVDVHPPIMAWLWSQTNSVIPGPQGLFLLLITLYWVGFFLLIRYLLIVSTTRAIIACVLPFSPILFNFVGTLWKDVLVFGCFLVATGIILTQFPRKKARLPPVPALFVVILLLVGCLARWNSVLGAIPLVVLALWRQPAERAALRHTTYRLLLCAPFVILAWAASGKLLNATVFHAEQTGFVNMLPLWNLVGMSDRVGQNLLPGPWSDQQFQKARSCYNPIADNDFTMSDSPCYFVHQHLVRNGYWHSTVLFPIWAEAIVHHPEAYLQTQLAYVRTLFWPNVVFMFDADDGAGVFDHHSGLLFHTEKRLLAFCRTAPALHLFFTVGFWIIAAAILVMGFTIALARGWGGCYPSLLLSLSAGANLWPLVIIGPDGQLRFAYWSIAAMCIALLLARRAITPFKQCATQPAWPAWVPESSELHLDDQLAERERSRGEGAT